MGQPLPSVGFGRYLRDAIHAAGYSTPTQFARQVRTDPSVVLRWISEEQRPTIRSIERIAPVLGRTINEMVNAAYPDRLQDPAVGERVHPVQDEIGRLLAPDSPLTPTDQGALIGALDEVLATYRRRLTA